MPSRRAMQLQLPLGRFPVWSPFSGSPRKGEREIFHLHVAVRRIDPNSERAAAMAVTMGLAVPDAAP